jgi:hypothetical protein
MPRTYSSIDEIRAGLAWVSETPDPNKCGCRMFDAVRKLDTGQELVPVLSQPSSGHSGGSITASHVVSTDGAEVSLAGT